MEIRYSDLRAPGIVRVRRGRGFSYRDAAGQTLGDAKVLARIEALAIPPAWTDVWICSDERGHIQAVGTDAAQRRQYRYHDEWRACRDRAKFERMLEFARSLPDLRVAVAERLAGDGLSRERVLACAVRLLDCGFFRIGNEDYAEANDTYGLATLRKDHVRLGAGHRITFDYQAKSRKRRLQTIVAEDVYEVVAALRRRRGGGDELLAYRNGRGWRDVRSTDINAFVKEATGAEFSAKDFRTWNATVLAAVAVAVSPERAEAEAARKRIVARAVQEVSHYLGNTPAVCRSSYIDPRVFERYEEGLTIGEAIERVGGVSITELGIRAGIEEAVLGLIECGVTRGRRGDAPCAIKVWEDPAKLRVLQQYALHGA